MKKRNITKYLLCITLFLFVALIITSYVLDETSARYVSSKEINHEAIVATWDPHVTSNDEELTIKAGDDYKNTNLTFVVDGAKEVASNYSVTLKLTKNENAIDWPLGVEVAIKDTSNKLLATSSTGVFENLGKLGPGESQTLCIYLKAASFVIGGPYKVEVSIRLEQTN